MRTISIKSLGTSSSGCCQRYADITESGKTIRIQDDHAENTLNKYNYNLDISSSNNTERVKTVEPIRMSTSQGGRTTAHFTLEKQPKF